MNRNSLVCVAKLSLCMTVLLVGLGCSERKPAGPPEGSESASAQPESASSDASEPASEPKAL